MFSVLTRFPHRLSVPTIATGRSISWQQLRAKAETAPLRVHVKRFSLSLVVVCLRRGFLESRVFVRRGREFLQLDMPPHVVIRSLSLLSLIQLALSFLSVRSRRVGLLVTRYRNEGDRSKNPAYSSATSLFQKDQRRSTSSSSRNPKSNKHLHPNVIINKKLVEFGKKGQWEDILDFAIEEQRNLNNVNVATAMSQLGRTQSLNKSDPRFLGFLNAIANILEVRGLPWIKAREAANIIYAIGKMELKNACTKQIMEWITRAQTQLRGGKHGRSWCVCFPIGPFCLMLISPSQTIKT